MDLRAARLWSTTALGVWPEDFFVIDFAAHLYSEVSAYAATITEPFVATVYEPDQVSLTISCSEWQKCSLQGKERDAGGPFGIVTLKQDVGLEVFGFLAPPIQRFADAQIAIIPHGSYLKEHWVFLREDFDRALKILEDYIEEQKEALRLAGEL